MHSHTQIYLNQLHAQILSDSAGKMISMDHKGRQSSSSSPSSLELFTATKPSKKSVPATNKKIEGRKLLQETRRRGYRGMRRRNENESVFEVGRRNKKSRTLTGAGTAFSALTSSSSENEQPQLRSSDPTQRLPQAQLTSRHDIQRAVHDAAKNFQPSSLDAWSPNSSSSSSSSSITRETQVEETCPIDFPCKKEVEEDSSIDYNGVLNGFIDEEEMFNMPGLVNSMAEGMLLTPPAMKRGFKWSHDDQFDDANYINLWGE